MSAWPTDTFLLVLAVVALVLSVVAYIHSRITERILREMPEPRNLPEEIQQLREVAARDYAEQARQAVRIVKR